MKEHHIEMLATDSLIPNASNARTHSKKQISQIAKSMQKFGFINPIIVDAQGIVLAGHGRLLAAKSIDLARLPVIRADNLTESQRRAYSLADNKIALNAGWDKSLLRVEIEKLMDVNLDFSIDITGFSTPEIDIIVHGADSLDEVPPALPTSAAIITQVGDVWQLGDHRVICGDSRQSIDVERVLAGDRVGLVITDSPYNVKISGHVSGLGQTKHAEFAMASGEMSRADFTTFLTDSVRVMAAVSREGTLIYLFMDWRHLPELQAAVDAIGLEVVNLCVWVKSNGGMGSMYRSQHELVLVVKKPGAPHVNNVELGKHGRYRTNVWRYAGMNAFGSERDEALRQHPTVKPVAMIRDAILDASLPGDWVFDPFIGSGTTLLAAEQSCRRCLGVELNPAYVDVALERWHTLTGKQPHHVDLKANWTDVKARRTQPMAKE